MNQTESEIEAALRVLRRPTSRQRTGATRPISFILRYGDSLFGVDTIAEHTAVVQRHGYVWLGKYGVGPSRQRVERMRAQIAAGSPAALYLWTNKAITHVARILDVAGGGARNLRTAPEPSRVPKYYRDAVCAVWFKLGSIRRAGRNDVKNLRLESDSTSIPHLNTMQSLICVVRATRRQRKGDV